ncbi:MAG: YigZ family protein [Lachnospiraceae bacterium]|nr:YigZ family protein [Lachnospiraceae bacterium]
MNRYQAVFEGGSGEIVEKKSRFIAHVQAAETVEEAQQFIDDIKKKYWDARHNCSAFSVGVDRVITRSSDDGEPSGTAGKPILEVILGSGIHNIVIVVTRYFGGTLLGTGGLVRAYTEAARAGIEQAVIIEKISGNRVDLETDYTDLGKIQYILAQNEVTIEDTDYTDKVTIHTLFPKEEKQRLSKMLVESTGGRVGIVEGDDVYFGVAEGEVIVFDE